jgi:hypothetical protein
VASWKFCRTGLFGSLYAPLLDGGDEQNLLDVSSTLNVHGQPTDGAGLMLPVRQAEHRFRLMVPISSGSATESYETTLVADPADVPSVVRANAGSGRLF